MTDPLLSRVLVPVASEDDAAATADAVVPRVADAGGRVTAVVVVEKAGGSPDKASVEQRELTAEAALDLLAERGAEAGVPVETDIVYGTDVADAILQAARDADATAIAFTPRRGGGLLVDLLTGDVARRLVERSDRPVVVLPSEDPPADADAARGGVGGDDDGVDGRDEDGVHGGDDAG